jgi:hypothetical protein
VDLGGGKQVMREAPKEGTMIRASKNNTTISDLGVQKTNEQNI